MTGKFAKSCGTSAYFSLVREHGMRPKHAMTKLAEDLWSFTVPGRQPSQIDTEDALHSMAYEALQWLRHQVGYDIDLDSLEDLSPASVLCRIRSAADAVLA